MPESDFSGSFPHDFLDLRDWRWQGPVKASGGLGTEGDGKAISVPDDESDTTKITIFQNDPWFMLVDDDTTPYVRLGAPARGATTGTSSSSTTRSELRDEVRIAAVRVAHNIPWTPGGYTPVGPGVATKSGLGSGIPGHAQKPCDLLEFAGPHQAWKLTLDVDDDGQDGADSHDYGEALFRSITVETET